MSSKNIETYYPTSRADWRRWLVKNHETEQSVWLVFYNKKSEKESISWSDAVDEALCFGWIDSKKQTIDEFSYRQYYSKRKSNSTWSKINKAKVEQLVKNGLMTKSGLNSIEVAKQNGSWAILDKVENLTVPKDLKEALASYKNAFEYFDSQSKSNKKMLLYWVTSAKRPETRQKRIEEISELASVGKKPKQFR
ncbi:YdeI/OmpD-associated family protein [Marivirga atlantica]|uniref:YdeI/OmpD-associated family protein n=1 Tax=Marivirga atlantica TaxID=1548457 RepID=A0A937A943_9BACT|nr:YdeI/OmpD-associated family protein [Marivirga atlantica]MBL0766087.1 YdeI/OmpD-associated family protein [Marivirga atlantica]